MPKNEIKGFSADCFFIDDLGNETKFNKVISCKIESPKVEFTSKDITALFSKIQEENKEWSAEIGNPANSVNLVCLPNPYQELGGFKDETYEPDLDNEGYQFCNLRSCPPLIDWSDYSHWLKREVNKLVKPSEVKYVEK